MSTPPPFAAFPSQWMKHRALLQRLPLTRALKEFFLRFTPAFWLTSINRYHGFSRVGLARFFPRFSILGDPRGDSGNEGKSKRAEKYGTKKSKERREEPLGTMSYQTSSKRSPPFWLLIGARKTQVFWHQSEARTAATVWNWSGKTLSPRALLAVL